MVTALDVDANLLINKAASKLKALGVQKPAFAGMVKTGPHNQRPPESPEFWYVRCASLMRKAYLRNVIGTNRLRTEYGGRKSKGVKRQHHIAAGGSHIRKAMQALEKAGMLVKLKVGRTLTPKGRKFLDSVAKELKG